MSLPHICYTVNLLQGAWTCSKASLEQSNMTTTWMTTMLFLARHLADITAG
jgi:uncharacterized membrane protein SirB2